MQRAIKDWNIDFLILIVKFAVGNKAERFEEKSDPGALVKVRLILFIFNCLRTTLLSYLHCSRDQDNGLHLRNTRVMRIQE